MNNIPKIYKLIHSYTFENESILKKYKECVCLYCGKKMLDSDIKTWISDNNGKTAQCPYCSVDSIVPLKVDNEYTLTEEMLKELYKIYF